MKHYDDKMGSLCRFDFKDQILAKFYLLTCWIVLKVTKYIVK